MKEVYRNKGMERRLEEVGEGAIETWREISI